MDTEGSDNIERKSEYDKVFDQSVDKLNEDHSFQSTDLKRRELHRAIPWRANKPLLLWICLVGVNLILFLVLYFSGPIHYEDLESANKAMLTLPVNDDTEAAILRFTAEISASTDPKSIVESYDALLMSLPADRIKSLGLPSSSALNVSDSSVEWRNAK